MRGENSIISQANSICLGTSPRARGKPRKCLQKITIRGNIPACAGKTVINATPEGVEAEHPRVRGENADIEYGIRVVAGTSPRARGKLAPSRPHRWQIGNIPACAGKTQIVESPIMTTTGTSPRARGKRHELNRKPNVWRNIPACAGKTSRHDQTGSTVAEHPRVRGENNDPEMQDLMRLGTSPRARGKLVCATIIALAFRNIPACAGKTVLFIHIQKRGEEHPRVRGENGLPFLTEPLPNGNIPACAGKTQRLSMW